MPSLFKAIFVACEITQSFLNVPIPGKAMGQG